MPSKTNIPPSTPKEKKHIKEQVDVYNDLIGFINDQEQDWKDYCHSCLAWGSLMATFEFIFSLAPNKDEAVHIITESMTEFVEQGKC